MKKAIFTLFVFTVVGGLFAQKTYKPNITTLSDLTTHDLRSHNNTAFRAGEKLSYLVHYGWLDAGEAVMEVKNSPYDFAGRDAYHIVGTGKSLGAFDWFFEVNDRYETYIDKKGIFPYRFVRDVNEGGYKIKQDYVFHPEKSGVETQDKKVYETPEFVHDMLSSFYYARTLDFSNVKKGDTFTIEMFMDNEVFPLRLKYVKNETVKVKSGKYRCLKFVPEIQEGRVFKEDDDLEMWITDDANRIPILVKAGILVGSIKMELTDYSGTVAPLAEVSK